MDDELASFIYPKLCIINLATFRRMNGKRKQKLCVCFSFFFLFFFLIGLLVTFFLRAFICV